jgi:hypothetical protein
MRIERVLEDLRRQEAELRKIQEKTEREMGNFPAGSRSGSASSWK